MLAEHLHRQIMPEDVPVVTQEEADCNRSTARMAPASQQTARADYGVGLGVVVGLPLGRGVLEAKPKGVGVNGSCHGPNQGLA